MALTLAGAEREGLLHDAREAAKQARYAGESVARIFGEDAVRFAQAIEEVTEALGEHQYSVLTRGRLRELGEHTSSTRAAEIAERSVDTDLPHGSVTSTALGVLALLQRSCRAEAVSIRVPCPRC